MHEGREWTVAVSPGDPRLAAAVARAAKSHVQPSVAATTAAAPVARPVAYRIVYRLTGHGPTADRISDRIVRSMGEDDLRVAAWAAMSAALNLGDATIGSLTGGADTHAQQRRRLRRDLRRWQPDERFALTLRHLVGIDLRTVACLAGFDEDHLRRISSTWAAADAGTTEGSLLRDLDCWIGDGPLKAPDPDGFRHLDEQPADRQDPHAA